MSFDPETESEREIGCLAASSKICLELFGKRRVRAGYPFSGHAVDEALSNEYRDAMNTGTSVTK